MSELNIELETLAGAVSQLESSIDALLANAEKAAKLIERLTDALVEIEEYAEDQYDGPEDRHWGWVLARCQDARGR